jgi:hypothetical protein
MHSWKPVFSNFNDDEIRRLKGILETKDYSDRGILQALDIDSFPTLRTTEMPILMHRTAQGRALDTLIRLFLMEVPVSISAAERALAPMKLSACQSSGLLEERNGEVASRIKILPYKGLLVASDPNRVLHSSEKAHFVMGIGASSITLSNLTLRRPFRATLDLGTGCGIQGLLAARHSDVVIATDKNPRASQLALFNARLNGYSHMHSLVGDLFEPFEAEAFDLVITNPPFVISPETRYVYRDGGMPADQICRRIIREVPRYLSPGGFCQMLCNWAETVDGSWQERIQKWFEGTGCDGWVIRSEIRDAAVYADTWIRHTEPKIDPAGFAEKFDTWMEYYKRHGIIGMSAGMIILRKSDRDIPHFWVEEGPEKMLGPSGEDIWAGFLLRDYLSRFQRDSLLLAEKFTVASDVRLIREAVPSDTGWTDTVFKLQRTAGMAYQGDIDPYIAHLVAGCNGKRPLIDLVIAMATEIGENPEVLIDPACKVVRGLVSRGFLLPAEILFNSASV